MSNLKITTHNKIINNKNEETSGGQTPLINTWITNDSETDIKYSSNSKKETDRKGSAQKKIEPLETPQSKGLRPSASTAKYASTP
jgi:hypothetical protein